MSREIKRVPLDFKWPIGQIWKGYWHPFNPMKCKPCDGSGYNPEYKKLSDDWYDLEGNGVKWSHEITQDEVQALLDAGRLMDFTRVPLNDEQAEVVKKKLADGGNSWLPFDNGYIPTAEEVNKWSQTGFGHDAINRSICVQQRAKRLGISDDPCQYCDGGGSIWPTEEVEKMSENWQTFDPPKGEGFQLWETTSEGSPISPVFETPQQLAHWLEENNASTFGRMTATYDQWLKFITGSGRAISAVYDGHTLKSGVTAK